MSAAPAEPWSREEREDELGGRHQRRRGAEECEDELGGRGERQRARAGKDEVPVDASEGCRAGGTQVVQGV